MLKGIPPVLSPELFKILMEMGHGDEIILANGNFPAASLAQRLVRCDGLGISEVLSAILKFFPLDDFVKKPVSLMAVVSGDSTKPVIWEDYKRIIQKYDERVVDFEFIERFEFYERAKKAYAVVATGETIRYSNIILKKGIIIE